jgi:hypothetical protein
MESGKPYAILAKSTVICAGPASFRPLGYGFPCSSATADGEAMAYRVGAEISGKEFNDGHPGRMDNPFKEVKAKIPSGDGITMKSPLEVGGGPPGSEGPVEVLHPDLIGMRVDTASIVNEEGLPLGPGAIKAPGAGTPKTEGIPTSGRPKPGFDRPGGPDGFDRPVGPDGTRWTRWTRWTSKRCRIFNYWYV